VDVVSSHLQVGAVIDDLYSLEGVLGRGGSSTVYVGRQLEDGERVAIKVVAVPAGLDAEIRQRFFNELLLATRVQHPNIVGVHDFGVLPRSGAPFIVMECLNGRPLSRHLRVGGPLSQARAVPLFLGVLSALAVAHSRGVVHKDLKPSNLFLCEVGGRDESLVILDFGVASRVREGRAGGGREISGTPAYMAPEYIERGTIGPALDVYQMGLVLAEALTGRTVVARTDAQACFSAHLLGELDLPDDLLSGPLGPVLLRALARDPAERFPNAGALLAALAAVHDVAAVVRRTTPPPVPRMHLPRAETPLEPTRIMQRGWAQEAGEGLTVRMDADAVAEAFTGFEDVTEPLGPSHSRRTPVSQPSLAAARAPAPAARPAPWPSARAVAVAVASVGLAMMAGAALWLLGG
jgi:serine/threonine protein kinase